MGARCRAWLAILLGVAAVAFVSPPAVDKLAELQAEFDRESSGVRKAKLMEKLGEAEFVLTREAGKSNDYTAVDVAMEKYRDNVRSAFETLKKQHSEAEKHPNGFKQLEACVRKGIREVDETMVVAPSEYKPPLQLVRQDLVAYEDELLRMLFPRRPGEKPLTTPAPVEKKP